MTQRPLDEIQPVVLSYTCSTKGHEFIWKCTSSSVLCVNIPTLFVSFSTVLTMKGIHEGPGGMKKQQNYTATSHLKHKEKNQYEMSLLWPPRACYRPLIDLSLIRCFEKGNWFGLACLPVMVAAFNLLPCRLQAGGQGSARKSTKDFCWRFLLARHIGQNAHSADTSVGWHALWPGGSSQDH